MAQAQPLNTLYSAALVALAQSYRQPEPLGEADVSVEMQSKLCGSVVQADLKLAGERITAHAVRAEADALGRAATALVQKNLLNASVTEIGTLITAAREAVLKEAEVPETVEARWPGLHLLRAIHPYTNRHPSTLLVFEVLERAIKQYEASHG